LEVDVDVDARDLLLALDPEQLEQLRREREELEQRLRELKENGKSR
jgi:cell division protein ZapA (FtsZ GTPase activity inhibitor)